MSIFGLLSLLLFLFFMGGMVVLDYGGNSDLAIAKIMLFLLRVLIFMQAVLAIYEFPCYVVDGIVFACMGKTFLAKIMFAIVGAILLFIAIVFLPKIKWGKHLTPTPARLVFLGVVFICLFAYTELYNGAYSFDSIAEFQKAKEEFEELDDHFWPTKYIKHTNKLSEREQIAVYPLDFTFADGTDDFIYKGETYRVDYEDGTYSVYYFPFTWKLYEGSEPVLIISGAAPVVSGSDVASATDAPVQAGEAEAE